MDAAYEGLGVRLGALEDTPTFYESCEQDAVITQT